MNHIARRMAVAFIVALAGSLLTGCGGGEPDEEAPVVRPVKMLKVSSQSTGKRLEYPGRVSPTVQSELSFEVPGRISSFPVREGQWMQEGELIARMDDRNYQAQLTSSQARLDAAKADYDRFKELLNQGSGVTARSGIPATQLRGGQGEPDNHGESAGGHRTSSPFHRPGRTETGG